MIREKEEDYDTGDPTCQIGAGNPFVIVLYIQNNCLTLCFHIL